MIVSVMIVSELLLSVSGQVTPRHLNPPRGAVTGYSLFMIGSNYSLFIILVARFTVLELFSSQERDNEDEKRIPINQYKYWKMVSGYTSFVTMKRRKISIQNMTPPMP